MMDTKICNKLFPHEWRSSIAISVYEPSIEDLPEEICERITYIKITCSITGYQPTDIEKRLAKVTFPDIPTEQLSRIIGQYFACYGTLLNVAVGPPPEPSATNPFEHPKVGLKDYPHIIDFEPKTRDLYQTTTEEGEILTASRSELNTSKSFTNADTTESGLAIAGAVLGAVAGAAAGSPQTGAAIGGAIGSAYKWGETAQDTKVTTVDDARERRERHATSTTLSQMYNLLTSYHLGTNRATFLMLPRPHILQPTIYRTFVQGVRAIEGVQEFFLIVARPKEMQGLSIEALLETSHFPEDVEVEPPTQEYYTIVKTIEVGPITVSPATAGINERRTLKIEKDLHGFEVDGWEFDPRQGAAGRPGIRQDHIHPDDNADGDTGGGGWPYELLPAMENYFFAAIKPDSVQINALLRSRVHYSTTFHRNYQIFLRKPKSSSGTPNIDIGRMIITSRGLCTGFLSDNPCPKSLEIPQVPTQNESVVDERRISVRSNFELDNGKGSKFVKEGLRAIQNAMTTSSSEISRRPYGTTKFIDTDYFKDKVAELISKDRMNTPLTSISEVPREIVERLGTHTVNEVLRLDLSTFARKSGLSLSDAAAVRLKIMGISTEFKSAT
jgi:hypothetical protein